MARTPESDEGLRTGEFRRLCAAVSCLKTPEEACAFLSDVCSPRELEDLAQRLEVATRLRAGQSYARVSEATGASSTTVSRVSKCLNGEDGGYRLVLLRLDGEGAGQAASS